MQDIPAIDTKNRDKLDLFGGTSWKSCSIEDDVFAGFLNYQAQTITQEQKFVPPAEVQEIEPDPATETMPEDVKEAFVKEDTLMDMKDIPVDRESFEAMKPQLEKYGLSKEDIKDLEEKVNSEKGMTWGQFVSFISSKMASNHHVAELSSGQRSRLMTFFQKLGFSAPQSQRMVSDLDQGNADQVMNTVNERLKSLPQDKLAGLDKDELDAFMKQIRQIKGTAQAKDMSLIRIVGKAMENAMDKARRMAMLDASNKNADANDQLAAKSLAEVAKAKANTAISRAEIFSDESPAAEQARKESNDAARLTKTLSTEDQLKAAMNKTEDQVSKGMKLGQHKDTDAFLKQDAKGEDKSWNEFFQKLRLDHSDQAASLKQDPKGLAEALSQTKTETTNSKPWTKILAPRVIKQVETAILKNLAGGGKRLTLQLRPEHLGSVNVMLSVKNSEVSAVIRADNTEAAKLIADQMESIRHSLEAQGLKVSKLEVQTQLPGQDNTGWQNLADQRKAFEDNARARSRGGKSGFGPDADALAQDMNNLAREAILSGNGNGLHVIA